jgi:hypothetical protein
MPYYPYTPSGTFILEVNPSGATPLISGGYTAATGATGAGGIYAASGFKVVDNFFFAHTTGNSADQDYLATGNPTNIALATGTGYVYGGDIRGTGDNYLAFGTTTSTGLASEVEHFVGAYARYTDAAGKTLTGLISGGNGYYTGSYTTLPPLQEFTTIFPEVDTGNLANSATGSGIHLFRDVTLTFSEIVDRAGVTLETQDQLQNNLFFNGFDIDILNITGGMVFSGYKSGLKSRSFPFSEQENINVFGTYTSDFAVRYSLQDQNGEEQVSEIYLYGNPLEIDFLYITDASGRYLSQSNDSNFITTGSGSDELFLTNRQYVTGEPITGGINIEFAFKNNPNFTEYGNSVHVYGQTGSADFARNASNFIATIPLNPEKAGQTYELTPKDGDAEGLLTETDYYFQLEPESAISKGKVIKVGPHKIQPVEQDPRDAGQPLYNRGNQYLAGDLDVAGCVTGECLTISTAAYPNTIETAGGNVGLGKVPGTAGSDPKLDINGRLQGVGAGGRVTGPGDVPYLLSGDAADSVTLQDVTDNGNTTTNDISCGTNTTPTAPVTIKTDASDHAGLDVYADGDLGNRILTLKADSSAAGEIIVKDTAGVDSVKLSNTSSRGRVGLFDAGGDLRGEMIVDSNNQGELTLKDSSANDSVKLTSDSNKRGNVNVYDAAGAIKVIMKADSNDKGQMSIKDAAGNESTKVQADKSVISAAYSNIYSTGSVIIGGSGHIISGDYDVIAGGAANDISGINGNFNFIGGGSGICIEESAYSSSVGGLNNDIITGDYSVIAGGKNNLISGNQAVQDRYNFIGGGETNTITGVGFAAIMGGSTNHIEAVNSFIGGGNSNNVYGEYAFIGGGEGNIARGNFSAILAGENNIADGQGGVIVGGESNFASGIYSLVGGQSSKASGDYSYAFGRQALVAATHSGAAVLADGQNRPHTSSGDHTLNLDFASGVYIGGGGALYVSGNPVMTGAHTVEEDTFQTVTNRGDTTTNSIEVAGKFLSGVTGKFSRDLDVGSTPALSVSSTNDRVGIAMNASDVNGGKLGVYGGAAIGSSYAPYYAPPSNGLLVEGRAGIGTPSPNAAHKLHVHGGAFATGVTIGNGIEGTSPPNNGLLVYGGATLGYYSAGANILDVHGNAAIGDSYLGTAAPSNGLIVEGNVGVGTSSPKTALDVRGSISGYTGLFDDKVGIGTNSPQAELDVARDTDVSGIIGRAQIGYAGDSDVASFAHVDFANATDFALAQTSAGHTVINARDGYNIYFREGDANMAAFDGSTKDFYVDTNTLYVDASEDRVGINEASPSYTLDVTASDASSLLSRFYNSSSTNGQGLLIRAGETANANRILQLASRNDTKVMTVNSNGRVGIGTDTTPTYKLDVGGGTSSTSNTLRINQNDGGTAIRMGAGGGSSDVVMLRIDGSSTAGEHDGETDKSKYGFSLKYMGGRSANANSLSLFSDNQAAANQLEALTVTQSGQLGILSTGISNFGADEITLQVGGPVDVDGSVTATTDLTANTSSSYTFIASDQSNMVSFNSANPITGLIPPNSSVPFPIGTEIGVFQLGAGQLHITTGSSAVSLNAADAETKARVQFSTAMCLKTGTDGWLLVGDLTS